jgi:hypothetical protein
VPGYGKNEFIDYVPATENEKWELFEHLIKVPVFLMQVENSMAVNARAEDLSQDGPAFLGLEPAPFRRNVLKLSIPIEKQLFKIKARVMHSQKDTDTGLFKTDVCFEDSMNSFRIKPDEEIIRTCQHREKTLLPGGAYFRKKPRK